MSERTPRVSIGLPVYNGEAFLEEAIDSLIAQTFADFELIVSDNASTDRTEAICRARAATDPRVRYHRNAKNIGAAGNFNRVFELARGRYFKWASHDDLHEPEYVRRCVEVLDRDPTVVLAFARARDVDEEGRTLRVKSFGQRLDSENVSTRFRDLIRRNYTLEMMFGVVRADVLRRTRLLSTYADCDRVMLAEIGLQGKIHEIPEPLFIHREHRNRSVRTFTSRQTRSAFLDPSKAGRPVFPYTRQLFGLVTAIRRSPLSLIEKLRCTTTLSRWLVDNSDGLWEDVDYAVRFVLRPLKRRLVRQRQAAPRKGG